jgi:hypothetical protein
MNAFEAHFESVKSVTYEVKRRTSTPYFRTL